MKLTGFRIVNCFGFKDSKFVNLESNNNIIFILGRNSSGKSTLLKSISSFFSDTSPNKSQNFTNFIETQAKPYLCARFEFKDSINSYIDFSESFSNLLKKKYKNITGLNSLSSIVGLIAEFKAYYHKLFELSSKKKTIFIYRFSDGNYYFSFKPNFDQVEYAKRMDYLQENIAQKFPKAIQINNKNINISIDNFEIENSFMSFFPNLFTFDSDFSLNDSLPPVINESIINDDNNELTNTFINHLGKDNLQKYFGSNDYETRDNLINLFQGKIDTLLKKMYEGISKKNKKLLQIILHENKGIQITILTDSKKSFFSHISDNSKFLFSYFLYKEYFDLDQKILLFDEPNKGFHPSAQSNIKKFLLGLASTSLVIITTHSEYLLSIDDLLSIRVMSNDNENYLLVKNSIISPSKTKGDYQALQPLYDSIGLRFADHLSIKDKVVLCEGITDFFYIRAFQIILKDNNIYNIAPARGVTTFDKLIPFFISQNIKIKIIADKDKTIKKLEEDYQIENMHFFVIDLPSEFSKFAESGIEDLFTKKCFENLLNKFNIKINPSKFSNIPNSKYIKDNPEKSLIAKMMYSNPDKYKDLIDEKTKSNFSELLNFIKSDDWYTI